MKSLFVLFAFAAATWVASDALAQSSSDSAANLNPELNRRESRSYDNLVDHDSAFRNQRMHRECDPIESDDLRRQCMDSFGATATNSSGSSDQRRTGVGRGSLR
ncbi:MAG: hypothetical protein WDO24_00665 [Pseudomonadota bacterium]